MSRRVNNLERETTFMGRRALFVTSLLQIDCARAAMELSKYAKLWTPIIKETKRDDVKFHHIAYQKSIRQLASRFRQRAERMMRKPT